MIMSTPIHAPFRSRLGYIGLIAVTAAALGLSACDRPVQPETRSSVGDKVDSAVNKVEQGAAKVAVKAEDAAITASIKTELAKDPSLSALRINVDTKEGLVSLTGTAPDAVSRDRATRVAAAVKGVLSVDNMLVVNS
jgi:hyperosmotically inducible periplasmic protein